MRHALVFNADRTGFGIDQVRNPMTVGELMEILEEWDEDTLVIMSHDSGYTYGSIGIPHLYVERDDGEWESEW